MWAEMRHTVLGQVHRKLLADLPPALIPSPDWMLMPQDKLGRNSLKMSEAGSLNQCIEQSLPTHLHFHLR